MFVRGPASILGLAHDAKIARLGTGRGRQKPFRRKSSLKQLAHRRRAARHALFEPEIVDQDQLLGGKHDLKQLGSPVPLLLFLVTRSRRWLRRQAVVVTSCAYWEPCESDGNM